MSQHEPPPWGGMPVGVPAGVPAGIRLHRKGGPTTTDHTTEIITGLASWLPNRSFSLHADGTHATLAGRGLPRTTLTSPMRRDAALYEAPAPRTGIPGRPCVRGARLKTPLAMADVLTNDGFSAATVEWRGRTKDLLVWSRPVLWYSADKMNLVLLVIVRYPQGVMHDGMDSPAVVPEKGDPSLLDALASLRRLLWAERNTPVSPSEALPQEIMDGLLDVLATTA